MARNGSGTYTLPSGNPVVAGTLIEANWANTTLSDLATAMTDSLSRSGQGGMTAALRLFDGTISVPGVAFSSETSSGFYRAGAGDVRLSITGSQVMQFLSTGVAITGTLSATGNVGIGNASPSYALDIGSAAAGIRVAPSTTTNNAIARFVNGGGTGYVGLDANGGGLGGQYSLNIWHSGAYPIIFGTSDTARARIDSAGNSGWGVTSPSGRVDAIANAYGTFVARSSSSGSNTDVVAMKSVDSGAANFANAAYQAKSHVWGINGATLALELDNSANLKFNSGYGSVATAYGCRAWVNFNGTGTVAIRASGNVTSITDNGTGDYTVNLTTAMPDANYTIVGASGGQNGTSGGGIYLNDQATARTTALFRIITITTSGGAVDTPQINVAIFR